MKFAIYFANSTACNNRVNLVISLSFLDKELFKNENSTIISLSVSAFACLTLVGCQAVNDTLGAVNGALSTVNSVLSGTSSSSSSVYVSSQTQASVAQASARAKAESQAAQRLFNEAKPQIDKVVALIACGAGSKETAQYTDPDHSSGMQTGVMSSLRYHKSGCLDVTRINGIKKQSNNAVSFMVTYTSSQSGESVREKYTAIKQPDNEWLFRWF